MVGSRNMGPIHFLVHHSVYVGAPLSEHVQMPFHGHVHGPRSNSLTAIVPERLTEDNDGISSLVHSSDPEKNAY